MNLSQTPLSNCLLFAHSTTSSTLHSEGCVFAKLGPSFVVPFDEDGGEGSIIVAFSSGSEVGRGIGVGNSIFACGCWGIDAIEGVMGGVEGKEWFAGGEFGLGEAVSERLNVDWRAVPMGLSLSLGISTESLCKG